MPEEEFRRKYINVLADEIGCLFYPSDHFARYARNNPAVDK
jgi:hypothetical protein